MSVIIENFGQTSRGEETKLYIISNDAGTKITVSDYGATLVSIAVPDKSGTLRDVVLGYDSVTGYENGKYFFGAAIGRNANRIGGAEVTINGVRYQLADNDNGSNLHSGPDYYCKRLWEVTAVADNRICLSLFSPDGDQEYPGNLNIEVIYTLTADSRVEITYKGTADQDTIINMTNHSYFNLNGHASGSVMNQFVWIAAEFYTRADKNSIPTGEITAVTGTPMDFNDEKAVGQDIEKAYEALEFGQGYDHNWVLDNDGKYTKAARMRSEESGIHMDVYTDLPGLQLYTGNFIEDEPGKHGTRYQQRQALCFETQYFPDAVHKKNFASPVCRANHIYQTKTAYHFYVADE